MRGLIKDVFEIDLIQKTKIGYFYKPENKNLRQIKKSVKQKIDAYKEAKKEYERERRKAFKEQKKIKVQEKEDKLYDELYALIWLESNLYREYYIQKKISQNRIPKMPFFVKKMVEKDTKDKERKVTEDLKYEFPEDIWVTRIHIRKVSKLVRKLNKFVWVF